MRITAMVWIWALVALGTSFAEAKEAINWVRISFPPFLVLEGDQASGLGVDIEKVLRQNMPEYEHGSTDSNIKRLHALLEKGAPCACADYLIRTPAFEDKYYYSSSPTMITPTHRIIALKRNREKFGAGGRLSLERLLEKRELRLGVAADRSFGTEIDDILKAHSGDKHIYKHYSLTSPEVMIQMLLAGRVDYIIEYPPIVQYFEKKLEITEELAIYAIEEKSQLWTTGWLACTKNEQGKQVIEKADTILPRFLLTERFYQAATHYIDLELFPEFRDMYFKEMSTPQPRK